MLNVKIKAISINDGFYFYLPQAGGLRYCIAAAFASLKKYALHFFNPAFGGTEPKEALYAGTVVNRNSFRSVLHDNL